MRLALSPIYLFVSLLATATLHADEAPHARAWLDQLGSGLTQIESDLPNISDAAEMAAGSIADGKGFGVLGDAGLANELSNRAGAMLEYDGRAGEPGDVILFVFGLTPASQSDPKTHLIRQLNQAQQLRAADSVVIGIGSSDQFKTHRLHDQIDHACDVFMDNHVTAEIPTATTSLNAALAWTFQCELFAALTRLDKTPIVRESFETDTRKRRWQRYVSQRFHHDRWLDPIGPGKLGGSYISALRSVLNDIGTASWRSLARSARRAEHTLASGGTVWLRAGGRYLPYHAGGQLAHDPGLFTLLNHDGSNPAMPLPGKNDFVIAVGDTEKAGSYEWGEPEMLRGAGHGVAWIVNGYNTQPRDLFSNETLIDLWGPVGDCVVKVDHYDTRLGPVSGITSEAVYWMFVAEIVGRQSDDTRQ